jgi:hypothetical protein
MKSKFKVHQRGCVLVFEAEGLFKPSDALSLMALVRQQVAECAPVKALIDLRRAVLLLAGADWDAMAAHALREGAPGVPLGVLVAPVYEAECWRYCMAMMQAGRTRVPFTNPENAQAWLGFGLKWKAASPPARPSLRVSSAGL